jgi:(E)-4-hydroxy-3-methylbut-2-enyl-diphosphate synthase
MVGNVPVGGGSPVTVQSMTKTPTEDTRATVRQCGRLERAGCEIIRIAVPNMQAAAAVKEIKKNVAVPLIADVHFDYKLALAVIENGIDGVRINPGNIGGKKEIGRVARAAAGNAVAVRVGCNIGSIEKRLLVKYGGPTPEALVESALACIKTIEDAGHDAIKVSVKASSVIDTVRAYEMLSRKTRYPLHLGVTEAGPLLMSAVRSSAAMGYLLLNGIGDTIRVSVTGDPVKEVAVAQEILQSLGLRSFGPTLVSCPTCGRCRVDLMKTVEKVQGILRGIKSDIHVAVMGCVVNGPGEAREADVGLAAGKGKGVLFKHGRVVRTVRERDFVKALEREIHKLIDES